VTWHIEKSLTPALVNAVDDVLNVETDTVECRCPSCGHPARYPKVAREQDVERLAALIGLVERYIEDKHIGRKMLAECVSQAIIQITKAGGRR